MLRCVTGVGTRGRRRCGRVGVGSAVADSVGLTGFELGEPVQGIMQVLLGIQAAAISRPYLSRSRVSMILAN
jgi:hypothetical protein